MKESITTESRNINPNNQHIQEISIQGYAQPVLITEGNPRNPNVIIDNQSIQTQSTVYDNECNFGTSRTSTKCLFCRKRITTDVALTCNYEACFLCLITGFVCYFFIQYCLEKEIICCDAIHKCPECHKIIGVYHAI